MVENLVSTKKDETIPKPKERYSYSKLNSFNTCKYGYNKRYILHQKGIGNCFSSYGLLMHSILERYAKGEVNLWKLPSVYKWEFDAAVTETFPKLPRVPDMRKLFFDQGLSFLNTFEGYLNYKILGIEESFDIDIDDWIFTGVIDFMAIDSDNRFIIRDYKSKSSMTKLEQAEYVRQLYLYSLFVKHKFDRYPDELQFLLFRKQTLIRIPFDLNKMYESLQWANDTVKEIRECVDYKATPQEFFCNQLCNFREDCFYKGMVKPKQYNYKNKKPKKNNKQ